MGIKRKIKNYFYVKKHYPLSEKMVIPNENFKNILILDTQIPAFDKDSAANRLTEIAKFLGKYYNVYLMSWRESVPKLESKKYIQNLNDHNVIFYLPSINKFGIYKGKKHFFDDLLPKLDFVWCHRPEIFAFYIDFFKQKAPHVKIIYDMVDIHFLRMERGLELKPDEKVEKEVNYYKNIETELSKKADFVAVISNKEKEIMSAFIESDKLFTISNVHSLKLNPTETPKFSQRKNIFFIGSFLHAPNVDSTEILYHQIMPLVWKVLPDLKIAIIGSDIPDHILKMSCENFNVVGFVEDISDYYKSCLASVSPLRFGAGVKGKIGQALEYCLPVITTKIGAEGMFLKNEKTALISENNDYQAFANNIVKICTDENLWNTLHLSSEKTIFPFTIEAQKEGLFNMLK